MAPNVYTPSSTSHQVLLRRVDVIAGGALVWEQVLDRALERSPGAEVVTSEHDILDGIALSLT